MLRAQAGLRLGPQEAQRPVAAEVRAASGPEARHLRVGVALRSERDGGRPRSADEGAEPGL